MPTPPSFDDRVAHCSDGLSPAGLRVVRFMQNNREEVLIASATAIAAKAKSSDATVIRTTQALGFAGLAELRRALATELRASLSPAERLTKTLDAVGPKPATAFDVTLDIHVQSLESLRRSVTAKQFTQAVESIAAARRTMIFGIGPTSAMADYLAIQLTRFGLDAATMTQTGLRFADDLQRLRKGDLVVILAYGHVYAELAALLDQVKRHKLKSLLLTDSLAETLRDRVGLILSVARGRADMLSMHTATLGLIESLLVGVAAQRPAETVAALDGLNQARAQLTGKAMSLPARRAAPK